MADYDVRLKSNGAYWQAFWRTAEGPKVKSLGAKANLSRRQAEVRCRQLAVDLKIGVKRDGVAPRLSEWLKAYGTMRTDLSKGTRVLVEHTGRYLQTYFENDPPIDKITRADAAGWRADLAAGKLRKGNIYPLVEKAPRPLSEATVCKHVRTAKRIFEEATEENGVGHIDRNPFRKLLGRAPKPGKKWAQVTHADLQLILDACPNAGWKALFALSRLQGLRRGECRRLEWVDVNWAANRMTINGDIERETTKQRARVIPIEPARLPTGLVKILQEVLDAAPDGARYVCEGVDWHNIDKAAKAIVRKVGVPVYRKPFHTLRKNRATEIASQYAAHVLAEWMGHDIAVAAEFYLRVDDDLYAAPEAQKVAQSPADAPAAET